jgi:adenylate cyclase
LANAYRLNGDTATALTTVDEAIKVAIERHARIPECLARIVRADLLRRSATSDQRAEGSQELERARALMRETGAMLFENFLNAANVDHGNARQISTKAS